MQENVYRKLEKSVAKIEKKYQSLEEFVKATTNLDDGHKMKMREDISLVFQELEQVYQQLSDLELADLVDFKNLGRFDGEYS